MFSKHVVVESKGATKKQQNKQQNKKDVAKKH
jgi:hypothetical protein